MGGSRFVLFLVIAAMGGFAYLLIQWTNNELTDLRAGASSTASLEAESGVLSANATSASDSSASDGKYVTFASSANPTNTPTPGTGGTIPSQVLNLTNWKVTLPTGSSKPTEVLQPELATYELDPWFVVEPGADYVRFRAPVNAPSTTTNSSYPRSELREMKNNGTEMAAWSSTSGTHTMFIDEAITAVPRTKKHVVAGQIHDAGDDVIVIRLELPKLFVDINGTDGPVLDANYTLGKRFSVKFVANGGKTSIYYNNASTPSYVLSQNYTGAYFKAGVYTQSNCSKELSSDCVSDNYGEVKIWNVWVTHE